MAQTVQKEWLLGMNPDQLGAIAASLGMPRFAAGQIASWLYRKGAVRIAQMTDLSLRNRQALEERFEVGRIAPARESASADGTKKYLFPTLQGGAVESAWIPDGGRATLCVSSQAGCRMGCRFCATGRQGLAHNLTEGEILNQVLAIPEAGTLTNIVYMGMGEPLDNLESVLRSLDALTAPWGFGWSPTRITLSTAGIMPALETFLDCSNVHLAVSLHNPFSGERLQIMPVENAHPIRQIVEALRRRDFSHQRRLSFEYIVMEGLNDSPAHVRELGRLLGGLQCRINLIRFHKVPGSPYHSPGAGRMEELRDALTRKGIVTTIRASRGEDIEAACGLLSTRGR